MTSDTIALLMKKCVFVTERAMVNRLLPVWMMAGIWPAQRLTFNVMIG